VLLENAKAPTVEPVPELAEQLDCAPPELEEEVASAPLGSEPATPFEAVLGPRGEVVAVAEGPELVEALELVEQLPELPLTLDGLLKALK
jgi:hypothetical protein